jgi:hypothetical protein
MSNQSHYEKLGISEAASFEEIQTARTRLSEEYANEPKRLQEIEAAYDALLMERLRLRQEGKIEVPDGVRFAENKVATPKPVAAPSFNLPSWSSGFAVKPELWDWLAPTILYLVLAGLAIGFAGGLQGWMLIATAACLYFVYRKENRLIRSILFGFGGLALGFIAGIPLARVVAPLLQGFMPLMPSALLGGVVVSWFTFGLLWVISVFLK